MRFENEVFIKWQKDIDNAIFGEIKQKAIENGIRTEYALNEKFIISALKKQIPKKYELFHGQCSCPNCKVLFVSYADLKTLIHWEMPYCKYCGQALDWGDSE